MEPITFRTLAQNVVLLSFVATLAGLFALDKTMDHAACMLYAEAAVN